METINLYGNRHNTRTRIDVTNMSMDEIGQLCSDGFRIKVEPHQHIVWAIKETQGRVQV